MQLNPNKQKMMKFYCKILLIALTAAINKNGAAGGLSTTSIGVGGDSVAATTNIAASRQKPITDDSNIIEKTEFFMSPPTLASFTPPVEIEATTTSTTSTTNPLSSSSNKERHLPRHRRNIDYAKIHTTTITNNSKSTKINENNINLINATTTTTTTAATGTNSNATSNHTHTNTKDLSDILQLNLSNKNLNTTNNNLSQMINLVSLDLSLNNLKSFQNIKFNSLHFLNLSHNLIKTFSDATINTQTITKIDLSCNKIESSAALNFSSINLEVLDLSCNKLMDLHDVVFVKLKNLKFLSVACNNIDSVPVRVFQSLVNLESLVMASNNITVLRNETFVGLHNLHTLDLSFNDLRPKTIRALQVVPNLIRLSVAYNKRLGSALKGFVASWSLKELDASGTGLETIPSALTQSVRTLKLKDNYFQSIHCGDLDSYPLLQFLVLSSCHINDIEDDALGRLEILQDLYLDHNNLSRIPLSLPSNLENLFIQNNKIMDISTSSFAQLQNLKVLDLSGNRITYLPELPLGKLVSLNLRGSGLKGISQGVIKSSPNLKDLNLENNPVKCSDLFGIAEWATPCRNVILFDSIKNEREMNNAVVPSPTTKKYQNKCAKCRTTNDKLIIGSSSSITTEMSRNVNVEGSTNHHEKYDDVVNNVHDTKIISELNLSHFQNQQQLASSVKLKADIIYQKQIEIGLMTTTAAAAPSKLSILPTLFTTHPPKITPFTTTTTTSATEVRATQEAAIGRGEEETTALANNKINLNTEKINTSFLERTTDAKNEISKEDAQTDLSKIKSEDGMVENSRDVTISGGDSNLSSVQPKLLLPNTSNGDDDSSNGKKITALPPPSKPTRRLKQYKNSKTNLSADNKIKAKNQYKEMFENSHNSKAIAGSHKFINLLRKETTTLKIPTANKFARKADGQIPTKETNQIHLQRDQERWQHHQETTINNTNNYTNTKKLETTTTSSSLSSSSSSSPSLFEYVNTKSSEFSVPGNLSNKSLSPSTLLPPSSQQFTSWYALPSESSPLSSNVNTANNTNNAPTSFSTLPEHWNEIRSSNNRHSGAFIIIGATIGIVLSLTLIQFYRCIKPNHNHHRHRHHNNHDDHHLNTDHHLSLFNHNSITQQDDEQFNTQMRRDLLPMESLTSSLSSSSSYPPSTISNLSTYW